MINDVETQPTSDLCSLNRMAVREYHCFFKCGDNESENLMVFIFMLESVICLTNVHTEFKKNE